MKQIIALILFATMLFTCAAAETNYSDDYLEIQGRLKNLSEQELILLKYSIDAELSTRIGKNDDVEGSGEIIEESVFENWKAITINDNQIKGRIITTSDVLKGTIENASKAMDGISAKLLITVKAKEPVVSFELYLNGTDKIINDGEKETRYTLSVVGEDEKGALIVMGAMNQGEDKIIFRDDDKSGMSGKVINRLLSHRTIYIGIDDKQNGGIYRFTIEDTTGFENALNWLLSEEEGV